MLNLTYHQIFVAFAKTADVKSDLLM